MASGAELACTVASVVLLVLGPRILGEATNLVFDGLVRAAAGGPGVDYGALRRTLLVVFCLYAAGYVLLVVQSWLVAGIVQRQHGAGLVGTARVVDGRLQPHEAQVQEEQQQLRGEPRIPRPPDAPGPARPEGPGRQHNRAEDDREFARCHLVEHTHGTRIYSADPGCPHQRGTNENTNGLIRQFFPKGIDFQTVTPHELRRVETLMNQRPRRCLDYKTPAEVFLENSSRSNRN